MPELGRLDAIASLQRQRAETLSMIGRLTMEQITKHGLGGGDWSIVELLGHLESWEEHALEALGAWSRGQRPEVIDALRGPGLDAINAVDLARKARRTYEEQLALSTTTHESLIGAIEALSDAVWGSPPSSETERTLGDILGGLVGSDAGPFTHDIAHLPDLRALLDETG